MKFSPFVPAGLAVFLFLASSPAAKADPIPWKFAWSRSPADLTADVPDAGRIEFTGHAGTRAKGDSDIVAANLFTHSGATDGRKAVFTARPYTLKLSLTDLESGDAGTLTFTGKIDGWLTAESSWLRNTFTSAVTQSLPLGSHRYFVTIGPYTPPTLPDGYYAGSIGAQVTVDPVGVVQQLPEPAGLVLASLGLTILAAGRRCRRGRRAGE